MNTHIAVWANAKGHTARHGATEINELVNITEFFQGQILPELKNQDGKLRKKTSCAMSKSHADGERLLRVFKRVYGQDATSPEQFPIAGNRLQYS